LHIDQKHSILDYVHIKKIFTVARLKSKQHGTSIL